MSSIHWLNEGLKSIVSLLYINTFYIAEVFLKSLAGCKTRKRVVLYSCEGRLGTLMLRGAEWACVRVAGTCSHCSHCSLPARFSRTRDPNLREICVVCSILEINRNEEWACGWCGLGMENKKEDTFLSQYSVRSFVRLSWQCAHLFQQHESIEMNMTRLLCVWPRTARVTKQTRARGANPRHNQQPAEWSAEYQRSVSWVCRVTPSF